MVELLPNVAAMTSWVWKEYNDSSAELWREKEEEGNEEFIDVCYCIHFALVIF